VFADMSPEEYMRLNGYLRPHNSALGRMNSSRFLPPMNVGSLPDAIDWRDQGYVTAVKDQGNCGSCWAFSVTGALEGQHKRATGVLVSLSEQNLLDCDDKNYGCDGGLVDVSFRYIKENGGIDTEASYPYRARAQRACHFNRSTVGATETGYVQLKRGDEEVLKMAVATQGPISVAIDASPRSFELYKSGVYNDAACSSDKMNHCVLLVGYGTDPIHGDYWLVKNSWGMKWGEEGYIRMARDKGNMCGIANEAMYPLV